MLSGCKQIEENIFVVPSKSNEGKTYVVDMKVGLCQCKVGSNGSPCAHQYLLWAYNFIPTPNFFPMFNQEERKRFAEIAIGDSLETHFYEPLSANKVKVLPVTSNFEYLDDLTKTVSEEVTKKRETTKNAAETDKKIHDEVQSELEDIYQLLGKQIATGDQDMCKAVIKFSKRLKNLKSSHLTSALHSFGGVFVNRSRTKIKVQPTAVSRRKSKIGSRQKQDTSKFKKMNNIPNRIKKNKRKHNLSQIILNNQAPAKKAGRTMPSLTK